jgi:hypothetical protein
MDFDEAVLNVSKRSARPRAGMCSDMMMQIDVRCNLSVVNRVRVASAATA